MTIVNMQENLVKIGRVVVPEMCSRTNTHTHTNKQTDTHNTPLPHRGDAISDYVVSK